MLRRVAHGFEKLQHPVAPAILIIATFRSVKDWKQWFERARVAKARSKKSDSDLAAAVTETTGRKAGRAQVNHWFTGTREPTISQFMSLCAELGADPGQILFDVPVLPASAKGSKAAQALEVDPTKTPSYGMQEKRLAMRRDPARLRLPAKKRRSTVT